jgi:hypothetical protein
MVSILKVWRFKLEFGRGPVAISAGVPNILKEIFVVFPGHSRDMLGSCLKSRHDQLHQLLRQVIFLWFHSALLISTTDIIVKIPEIDKYFKHVSKDEVPKISKIYVPNWCKYFQT